MYFKNYTIIHFIECYYVISKTCISIFIIMSIYSFFNLFEIIELQGGNCSMRYYFPRKPYKVCGYKVGAHALKRMKSRGITKFDLRFNLSRKPLHISPVRYNKRGRPSYLRYSRNKTVVAINPKTNHINTTWRYHTRLMNKFLKGGK